MQKLADILCRGASQWPDSLAVADANQSYSYASLATASASVGSWLVEQGVAAGDRVVVCLPNSARFVVALFGVQFAGAVVVPLDPTLPEAQISAIVERTRARVVLSESSPWEAIFENSLVAHPAERQPEDLAALMFTTGTTGRPKGVMLTHANILAALSNIIEFVGYRPTDREVITLPLTHNFGLGHVYCNLVAGGAVYLEPGLKRIGRVLKAIESFGATGFPTTPMGVSLLLDRYAEVFKERAKNLRFMVVNSAPLPPERAAQLQAALPDLNILVYYGLTEASRSCFISLSQEGPARYRSVGKPMPGVQMRLDDDRQVVIGGPTLTPGYWDDASLTKEKIINGELHTGDLGEIDDEGNLYIAGRLDDTINIGGYKVNPLDVERRLESFPGVTECAVVGAEVITAYYVSDQDLDEDAMIRHCRKVLQVFETPQVFRRLERLPRTDSGKLKRKELPLAGI